MKAAAVVLFCLLLAGCGAASEVNAAHPGGRGLAHEPAVVRGRSVIDVSTDGIRTEPNRAPPFPAFFILNRRDFHVPAHAKPFAMNDFGIIRIAALWDFNIDVCGPHGKSHCGTAEILAFTHGTPGSGLWNRIDEYGLPIYAGQKAPLALVGLNSGSAAVVQKIRIPANQRVLTLRDFPDASYDFQVDFSNAGAGNYGTQLVIEYALLP